MGCLCHSDNQPEINSIHILCTIFSLSMVKMIIEFHTVNCLAPVCFSTHKGQHGRQAIVTQLPGGLSEGGFIPSIVV